MIPGHMDGSCHQSLFLRLGRHVQSRGLPTAILHVLVDEDDEQCASTEISGLI